MTTSPATTPTVTPSGLTRHRITVLLVDDQAIIGEAVRRMLADESDIEFHHCSDPTQALATANAVRPTVILQDLVMPEVDGLTLVKFFRANPATRDVPMIVLSSKEEPAIKAESFALGANDYVVKLPDRLELIARIRYHSRGYIALLQRNEAFAALQENQRQLAEQIDAASKYVRSLLPGAVDGLAPGRLALRPLCRLGRRHVRLPLAGRRPFRPVRHRRIRTRARFRAVRGHDHERAAVAVAAPDRLSPPRTSAVRIQQRLSQRKVRRQVLHDLVRCLPAIGCPDCAGPAAGIPMRCCSSRPQPNLSAWIRKDRRSA